MNAGPLAATAVLTASAMTMRPALTHTHQLLPCHVPPGTLRSNLDPWGQFEDGRLWEVLKAAQLGSAVSALGGLDARMQVRFSWGRVEVWLVVLSC